MSTPGFAAETSLYKSDRIYTGMLCAGGGALADVQMAQLRGGVSGCIAQCHGDDGCIECCLCVHRGGHPWQCCF